MRQIGLGIAVLILFAGVAGFASDWRNVDIGDCRDGTGEYESEIGMWVVQAKGGWLWGQRDSFHYFFGKLQGDGEITACIAGVDSIPPNTLDMQTKVGVMVRETLEPGSKYSNFALSPRDGYAIVLESRRLTNAETSHDFDRLLAEGGPEMAFPFPFWIKMERRGDRLTGSYSADGMNWSQAGETQTISMAETVYVGLAVTVGPPGTTGVIKLDNLTVKRWMEIASQIEIEADPKKAVKEAYGTLLGLGDWSADRVTAAEHEGVIAKSLLVIALVREIAGEADADILREYYRIVETFPNSPAATKTLTRITLLDRQNGAAYARKWLSREMPRERLEDFCLSLSREYAAKPDRQREDVLELLVDLCAPLLDRPQFLSTLVHAIGQDQASDGLYRHLIGSCMANASAQEHACVILRYLSLLGLRSEAQPMAEQMARWAAAEYQGKDIATCARTILADSEYRKNNDYHQALKAFAPGLFRQGAAGPTSVKALEQAIADYRTSTLLPRGLDTERLYEQVADFAIEARLPVVALHCQRQLAGLKGLDLDLFERSARKGLARCTSGPENETWFWKGMFAAEEGDLTTATRAYEEFLRRERNSVLAARAYYDLARAEMALGREAKTVLAKAKALSPCKPVIDLEQKLNRRTRPGG